MEVNLKLVEDIAKVARLNLTEEEKTNIMEDMKEVLNAFEKIQEVDTEDTEMSIQPVNYSNHLREDIPKKCFTQEESLSQTNNKKDNYFVGPRSV